MVFNHFFLGCLRNQSTSLRLIFIFSLKKESLIYDYKDEAQLYVIVRQIFIKTKIDKLKR